MTELSEFLLARIDEDEEWARPASGILGLHPDWHRAEVLHERGINRADSQFIARHDPARVLAECDAKRRLIEELLRMERDEMGWDGIERKVMGYLALPYADHPDYDEAWKP